MTFWGKKKKKRVKEKDREREKNETESLRDFHQRQGENTHPVCGKCQLQVP